MSLIFHATILQPLILIKFSIFNNTYHIMSPKGSSRVVSDQDICPETNTKTNNANDQLQGDHLQGCLTLCTAVCKVENLTLFSIPIIEPLL